MRYESPEWIVFWKYERNIVTASLDYTNGLDGSEGDGDDWSLGE